MPAVRIAAGRQAYEKDLLNEIVRNYQRVIAGAPLGPHAVGVNRQF